MNTLNKHEKPLKMYRSQLPYFRQGKGKKLCVRAFPNCLEMAISLGEY